MTNTLGFTCLAFAIKMLPLTIYMPLCFIYPALTALLSPLINKEKPNRTEWMAMAVAFIAIIFLSQGATEQGGVE